MTTAGMGESKRIFIIGASGHGLVCAEAAVAQGMEIVGWIDTYKDVGQDILGYKVLGGIGDLPALMMQFDVNKIFLAISNNLTRATVLAQIRKKVSSFELVSIIHPFSSISPSSRIGAGSLILAGAIINSQCVLGEGCIVNTKVSIDHESVLGDFASLLPGVTTGGAVHVDDYACVCAGAVISHGVHIGSHSIVGAGSTVLHHIPKQVLAFGSPARIVRPLELGENLLRKDIKNAQ